MYNLFLDDYRIARDPALYYRPEIHRRIYNEEKWIVVRTYDQFINYIKKNGSPKIVSFDHDLADIHYDMCNNDCQYEEYYDINDREMTGYDCAKWLIDYLIDNKLPTPDVYVHSMNPAGKYNIEQLFVSYKKLNEHK